MACSGGRGRTGTALACLTILDGVPAADAVRYVRQHYDLAGSGKALAAPVRCSPFPAVTVLLHTGKPSDRAPRAQDGLVAG